MCSTKSTILEHEEIMDNDIKIKLMIAKNVVQACNKHNAHNKMIPLNARIQYYTGVSTEVIDKLINSDDNVTPGKTFKDWYSQWQRNPSVTQLKQSNLLRDAVIEQYVNKKTIPTLSNLINYFQNSEDAFSRDRMKKNLREAGYLWKRIPGTYKTLLVENPDYMYPRQRYLEEVTKYRRAYIPFVYVSEKFRNKQGVLCDNLDPEEPEVSWYSIAVCRTPSGPIPGVKFNCPKSDKDTILLTQFVSYFEDWIIDEILPHLNKPSVFVFEEKLHHDQFVVTLPTINSTKKEMIQWLTFNNIPHADLHRAELFDLISKSKKNFPHTFSKLDERLRLHGHIVLRRPREAHQLDYFRPFWDIVTNLTKNDMDIQSTMSAFPAREWLRSEFFLREIESKMLIDDSNVEDYVDKILTLATYDETSKELFEEYETEADEVTLKKIVRM